ncbi:sulfotransferase family protein [Sinirhodobacter sp. WL0062]|uniref:Sulfotransferase family protein n=1 Tax=Rhodobacter flavimaris TaxID=2907145 RepID=A0ABS8YVH8_9RHOB|nr:sulfotransferase family 2 domain-containing protein [Sinirhodobacter sp. WL0062]MCE5973270.1 sulfotransferase family protein [Sinirhodobacter sp. WL0062]
MQRSTTIIHYAPAKLVVVLVPKCGSTTMIAAFLTLAGLGAHALSTRNFIRSEEGRAQMLAAGLEVRVARFTELTQMQKSDPGYRFMTVLRDPTQRFVSGYFSKINRYAKRFARHAYLWGKLRQALSGLGAWPHIEQANRHIRKLIPFEQFVAGMERHGSEWNSHLSLQGRIIGEDLIRYDRVLMLETLDEALMPTLREMGFGTAQLAALETLPRKNPTLTPPAARGQLVTPDLQARIARLYQGDLRLLGQMQ